MRGKKLISCLLAGAALLSIHTSSLANTVQEAEYRESDLIINTGNELSPILINSTKSENKILKSFSKLISRIGSLPSSY